MTRGTISICCALALAACGSEPMRMPPPENPPAPPPIAPPPTAPPPTAPPPIVIGELDPSGAEIPYDEATPVAPDPNRIEVAITVDDLVRHGPAIPGRTRIQIGRQLLDALLAHDVPGVYGFVNSGTVDIDAAWRQVAQDWLDEGYPLGNHTFGHEDMTRVGVDAFITAIDRAEPLLLDLMGPGRETTWKTFRFPFGREGVDAASKQRIREHLRTRGYRTALVTVDFGDWLFANAYPRCLMSNPTRLSELEELFLSSAENALNWADMAAQVMLGRRAKQIMVLHIGGFEAHMADRLLTRLESLNVRFISLDEALSDPVHTVEAEALNSLSGTLFQQMRAERGAPIPPPPGAPNVDAICP